ncbi:MAG TPA: transposase [Polyangiaceae bacterium]|nr:transposase [Polyangiaceae bacterium]
MTETTPQIPPAPPGKRRSFTLQQKLALLAEADQAGSSAAVVARRYGLNPSLLFRWKRMRDEGALTGLDKDEPVVPASEVKAMKTRIRELERLLGRKTEEAEILKDALDLARKKKLLSPSSSPAKDATK